MRLERVRVSNYKSVLDSDWFSVGDLTCLVGKNESGKTALIEAIEKLNSVDVNRTAFLSTDYPRLLWANDRTDSKTIAVASAWQLSDDETDHINGLTGAPVISAGAKISLTKTYGNTLSWDVPLDYTSAVRSLIANSTLHDTEKQVLTDAENVSSLITRVNQIPDPTERQKQFKADLATRFPSGSLISEVHNYLQSRLPLFLYYSQYDRLPGQVALDQLVTAQAQGTLDQHPGFKVFIALLGMVGTSPKDIQGIDTSENLIASLEAVQNQLSRRVFEYWTQNRQLKINFRFDSASPNDPAPFNTGKVFRTRIENTRHGDSIGLDERSTGFIWFFSFLTWFSEVKREHGDNLIILLDEPGLALHAKAQSDLLRFVREKLVPDHQVIYTTHSPFMIDASDLFSCRTVEDKTGPNEEVLGTKVGDDVLSTDRDTLFPLRAALGYELSQPLFVGQFTLLVEGPSDLIYLQWFSDKLAQRRRTALDRRWTITPCGGLSKVHTFMSLFGANGLHVAVLTDYGVGDKRAVGELRESELMRDGHVFTADMFIDQEEGDLEDIIGRENYSVLIKGTYKLTAKQVLPKMRPAGAPLRVTKEVGRHFSTLPPAVADYDHFAPARFLMTQGGEDSWPDLDGALDRFERLFRELNLLLPQAEQ